MEPEASQFLQHLETARAIAKTAEKTGLLGKVLSWVSFRRDPGRPEDPASYTERALHALRENAIETIASLELTVAEALQILGPDFLLDDLGSVNSSWKKHWEERASRVGIDDSERRIWWARLLAGEIKQPGTFSLRTLAVMDTLSTEEARLFTRICKYVWWEPLGEPLLIMPRSASDQWRPNFEESTLLENAGLVKFTPTDASRSPIYLGLDEPQGGNLVLVYDKVPFRIDFPANSQDIRCGDLVLTDVGKEIYRLTTPEYSDSYRDEILLEWRGTFDVTEMVGRGYGFD
ncbi:MAG: DUF2806 domain-containing protein [Chloroflexi bacterium]|nr:DUF2806 domain-containing protein [Chloroflexota bacterium]